MSLTADLMLRIFIGAILGGVIGIERELRSKGVGFRTHFLVALGSALLTVISAYGFLPMMELSPNVSYDLSRVAAQIVSGIGFIGAGIIIFQKNAVHGLTTAAGLWVTSAIGIACGVGRFDLAAVSAVMVILALEAMYFINLRIGRRQMTLRVTSRDRESILRMIAVMESEGVKIKSQELDVHSGGEGKSYSATVEMWVRKEGYEDRVWELMEGMKGSLTVNG